MDICSFCLQPGNLFTTGDSATFACAKCQPYVQDTNAGSDHDNSEINPSTDRQVMVHDGKLYVNQMSGEDCMFHCDLCNKSFDKNLKFQNHMRNHRAERKYVCPHCTKGFSQSNNLRAHLRIHTNERPYKCQECGKAFTQVTNLNNHIRLHTGEKPFACTEPGCDKAFAQVTNLNNHRKSHMREQRHFSCEMCGQVFPHRSQLSSHSVSAHGGWAGPGYGSGPLLACEACGEAFGSAADLMRHVHSECRERGDPAPPPVKRAINATLKKQNSSKGQEPKKKQSPTGNQVKCLFGDCKELFANMEEFHRHLIVQHSLTINSHKTKPKKSIDYSDEIIEIEDDEPTSELKSPSQSRCSDISKVAGKTKVGSTAHHMKQERPDSSSDSDTDTSEDDDEDSDSRESDRRKSAPQNVPAPTPIQKDVKLVCNLCFATFDSLQSLETHVEDEH